MSYLANCIFIFSELVIFFFCWTHLLSFAVDTVFQKMVFKYVSECVTRQSTYITGGNFMFALENCLERKKIKFLYHDLER